MKCRAIVVYAPTAIKKPEFERVQGRLHGAGWHRTKIDNAWFRDYETEIRVDQVDLQFRMLCGEELSGIQLLTVVTDPTTVRQS